MSTDSNIARIDSDGTIRWIPAAARPRSRAGLPLGDGGPACAANLNGTSSITVDQDAIYFAQLLSNRVRRIPF